MLKTFFFNYRTTIYVFFVVVGIVVSFLGRHPQLMEVPRLGVESELQLPVYTTAHGSTLLTEQGQGSNLHPHGYESDLFPLHHNRNSHNLCLLIEVLSPFTYNIITGIWGFKSNILLFDFYVFHLFCFIFFSLPSLGFIEYIISFLPPSYLGNNTFFYYSLIGCSKH